MEWMSQFDSIIQNQPLLALALAFGAGVLTGFTPCAYPMLPITVAFIGSKAQGSRARGFLLSSIYVLGMAIVYSALGAIAALSGKLFGALTVNPWVYLFVGNVCVLFALVMLEVVPLRTPAWLGCLQFKNFACHDFLAGLLIGGTSALVVSPCTTPVLGVVLTLVATGRSVLLAMALLFLFAYGMGALVILVGTFTGLLTSLPRSGLWMTRIQKVFAVMMILVAELFFIKAGELWL
ncbi:MAG: hypothetical protein AUK55_15805 [Syntrophobacteraceae bacterium CG2_30_61_12]|nr:MAG: hypothetical protein AUK55_15805 [Syntrophobacteraceae bacterium CG2_30_61_12]